jgi:hypothetical protein
MTQKHDNDTYLDFDPFEGDRDVDIRCQKIKIVKTKKEHQCYSVEGDSHLIKPGSLVRFESALVDNEFKSYWLCLPCIDEWIDEFGV